MTIKEGLKSYPPIETDLLLAHVLGKPKEFLYLHPDKQLSKIQERQLHALAKRREKDEPLAYIIGYKYFHGLKFAVNKDVLIPRPETEWLVDRATSIVKTKFKDRATKKQGKQTIKIIEVGTGSGCIAISLAKILGKRAQITATDVSAKALSVAKRNSKIHHANIKFIKSNLLNKVPGRFDIIIANLPYVPRKDYKKLKINLRYEPKLALVDQSGKFDLYRRLFGQLNDHAADKAVILLEIDPSAKPYLSRYLIKSGVENIKFSKDYHGLWRYAEFVWPQSRPQ